MKLPLSLRIFRIKFHVRFINRIVIICNFVSNRVIEQKKSIKKGLESNSRTCVYPDLITTYSSSERKLLKRLSIDNERKATNTTTITTVTTNISKVKKVRRQKIDERKTFFATQRTRRMIN